MSPVQDRQQVVGNRLLAALPSLDCERLLPDLQLVPFGLRETLVQAGEPAADVYFPLGGVFSLLVLVEDGGSIETAMVGNEGMVNVPGYLGVELSPHQVICQVPHAALCMRLETLERHAAASAPLRALVQRYVGLLLLMSSRNVACAGTHPVEVRLARWLLQTRDRVGADEFPMTHEFLASMLAVRRASVTVPAALFRERGLIHYQRGVMTILDPVGLEALACEDYHLVRAEQRRLFGSGGTSDVALSSSSNGTTRR